jgi:virginiamycin B lyase
MRARPALKIAAAATLLASAGGAPGQAAQAPAMGEVTEYPVAWPAGAAGRMAHHGGNGHEGGGVHRPHHAPHAGAAPAPHGSTHEIAIDPRTGQLWMSGQNFDALMQMNPDGSGMRFAPMTPGSRPHGLGFDRAGRLWATLEYHGQIVRLDRNGRIARRHDIRLECRGCPEPINPHPHGLGIGADGETIWFTGKATGTIGRLSPNGQVRHWQLPTVGSVPIYIRLGPDGNMWATELVGNAIARVTPSGAITEYPIPTNNSRPIAIIPGPGGERAMWFSEEAGNRVGRIDLACLVRAEAAGQPTAPCIAEYRVPKPQPNVILAGLAFDMAGNLWVQQYVDQNHPDPEGRDHIVRIDRAGLAAGPDGLRPAHFTSYAVPTRRSVMHRIILGAGGAMWFTEMGADRVGRILAR